MKRAIALLEKWLPAVHQISFRAWILSDLASYYARSGNADTAIALNRSAIEATQPIGDSDVFYRVRDHAQLLADLGRYKEATEALNGARYLVSTNGDAFIRHHLLEAECFLGLGSIGEASFSLALADARLRTDQAVYLIPQLDSLRARLQ